MRALAGGFWGTAHWALDWLGRGAFSVWPRKKSISEEDAYSMLGGAAASGIFGAVVGLLFAGRWQGVNAVEGVTFGFLLGVCSGVIFAATVQVIDDWIKDVLNSVDSK
jgi:hypothetical protein